MKRLSYTLETVISTVLEDRSSNVYKYQILEGKEPDISINSCHGRKKWLNLKFCNFISKHLKCIKVWPILKLQWSNNMMSLVYLYAQHLGTYHQSLLCKSDCPDHTYTWMICSILCSNSFGFSLAVFAFSHTFWENKQCYNMVCHHYLM